MTTSQFQKVRRPWPHNPDTQEMQRGGSPVSKKRKAREVCSTNTCTLEIVCIKAHTQDSAFANVSKYILKTSKHNLLGTDIHSRNDMETITQHQNG